MPTILSVIAECLGIADIQFTGGPQHRTGTSKSFTQLQQAALDDADEKTSATASSILDILFATKSSSADAIALELRSLVHETGWYENLAAAVLARLEQALKAGAPMGDAMKAAFDKVVLVSEELAAQAPGFVKDHPVYFSLVALGILVLLVPWAVEALGFAELGPVEGSIAAAWQARYLGFVPKGSWFAFFQRLGMVWRRLV